MVKGFQEKYGIYIHNIFGGNEGISFVGNAKDFPHPDIRAIYFPRWGVPGFKVNVPIAESLQSKIVDPTTKQVIAEPGIPGEMCIKGPAVFAGYYKRPDLTEKAFDDEGFFNSGDLFSIEADENGNLSYYLFHGRSKDLIIRGGFNVSPEEVENMLLGHPKIAEVAIVGYPDPVMGEKGCACVVLKPGETITLEEISEFLIQKDCAVFKRPEKLLVVQSLPRNPLNKIIKHELRKLVLEAS
jgi:acyl-CoA synthetase (AMP-forming)/AMP-acid ligase II